MWFRREGKENWAERGGQSSWSDDQSRPALEERAGSGARYSDPEPIYSHPRKAQKLLLKSGWNEKCLFKANLDHIHGHSMHQKHISLCFYIQIQLCLLLPSTTCAYVSLNQPVSTSNIINQSPISSWGFNLRLSRVGYSDMWKRG